MSELKKKEIFVTDTWASTTEIDILKGSDLWGSFMTGRMEKFSCGLVAVESYFGWTLSGRIPGHQDNNTIAQTVISLATQDKDIYNLWTVKLFKCSVLYQWIGITKDFCGGTKTIQMK